MFKCTNYFLVARRRSIEISRLFRITSRSSSSLTTTLFIPTSTTSAISFVPITTFPSSGNAASTSIIPTTSIIPSRDSLYLQWNTIKENLAEIYGEIRCTLLVNLEFSSCFKNTNTSKGLLIFVDMGSLLDISEDIKDDVEGDLGIVNNITTEMALEAGELILKHEDLQNIMDTIIEHHVTKKSFVPSKQKPKAILLCCTTGLGTTDKMKMLLQGCLEGIDIDVVEMTYAELSTEGNRCDVFRKYDIQFIITTSKLMIQGVTTLMLNELIDERGEKVIYSTVGRYCDKDKTQRFIENIVRSFTIKNLIGQLTILNPDKIMGDVEETVSKLEILEDTTYSIDQKKMLYIHMCVMVERLILEKGRLPQEDMTDDLKCRESFIKNLKESFSVIENKYNVSLNDREILMIYYLTENN